MQKKIILTDKDLIRPKENPCVYDFKISSQEVNKAEEIIYITNTQGVVVFKNRFRTKSKLN